MPTPDQLSLQVTAPEPTPGAPCELLGLLRGVPQCSGPQLPPPQKEAITPSPCLQAGPGMSLFCGGDKSLLKGHKELVDFHAGGLSEQRGQESAREAGSSHPGPIRHITLVWVGWLILLFAFIVNISEIFDVSLACEPSPDPQGLSTVRGT